MPPLFLTASTIVSAAGRGAAATLAALQDRRGALVACDFGDAAAIGGHIGRIAALDTHRVRPELAPFDCRNNRLADLALETDGFADAVADAVRRLGAERVAVVLGTSTAGVAETERAYRRRDPATGALPADFDYDHTHDMFSLSRYVRAALGLRGPALAVSTACASGARSFVDAQHLIACGVCDAAVVGGVDTLCALTLHGFAALGLIAATPCRPCDVARSGISIGEGAGLALLERAPPRVARPIALLGASVASDGFHMSTPHPDGTGAAAAMRGALRAAGLAPEAIDYIHLHGTGTRTNDAMEDRAVAGVFGTATPCSSTKGFYGHTLGAAGVIGALIGGLASRHDLMPGCLNVTQVDPEFRANVLATNRAGRVRRVISTAFGFGGINCTLVLGEVG
jgi:3-oxoacyl-[acyl-carrier-protein] synthase-1